MADTKAACVVGLDPRSAANLVRSTAGLAARIKAKREGKEVTFVCEPPSPGALLRLMALGARPGESVEFSAEGPDAGEAIGRVEKAFSGEEPPPAGAELERALRWWVAVFADPAPSEERRAKIREMVDDHLQHVLDHDRLWTGKKDGRRAAKDRWVYANKTAGREYVEVYRTHPISGPYTEEYTLEAGEGRQFNAEPHAFMSIWRPNDAGSLEKRREKKVKTLCEKLPRFLSRELDVPYDELLERWFA